MLVQIEGTNPLYGYMRAYEPNIVYKYLHNDNPISLIHFGHQKPNWSRLRATPVF